MTKQKLIKDIKDFIDAYASFEADCETYDCRVNDLCLPCEATRLSKILVKAVK